jgi:mRNA interferase MazF
MSTDRHVALATAYEHLHDGGMVLDDLKSVVDQVCGTEPQALADGESVVELHRCLARLEAATTRRCLLRGDVYRFKLPKGIGHEEHGDRFGVVVQADELLPRSVVLVAPTSGRARAASFRPEIEIEGATTRVLVEQVGAVDVQRLGDLSGHLSREELWGVGDALMTVFGLR